MCCGVQADTPSSAPPSLQAALLQTALSAMVGPLVAELYQTPAGQALQGIFGSQSKLARAHASCICTLLTECCSVCSACTRIKVGHAMRPCLL